DDSVLWDGGLFSAAGAGVLRQGDHLRDAVRALHRRRATARVRQRLTVARGGDTEIRRVPDVARIPGGRTDHESRCEGGADQSASARVTGIRFSIVVLFAKRESFPVYSVGRCGYGRALCESPIIP